MAIPLTRRLTTQIARKPSAHMDCNLHRLLTYQVENHSAPTPHTTMFV